MDWMGLEKILKKFDLFGIQTHPIPLNPYGLRANRTSPKGSSDTYQPNTNLAISFILEKKAVYYFRKQTLTLTTS
jgi:hypothetical protein